MWVSERRERTCKNMGIQGTDQPPPPLPELEPLDDLPEPALLLLVVCAAPPAFAQRLWYQLVMLL